jgi:hypothetical protein
MSGRSIYRGNEADAVALRAMAAASRKAAHDSFERCDTDGFLSQCALDITARQFERQAHIAEAGGLAEFTGLYQGERRVAARLVPGFRGRSTWLLRDDEAERFGRRFVPFAAGRSSRVQKALGLAERAEMAPAIACLAGSGTGLSGCASAFVSVKRTGCEWGLDATLIVDGGAA